MKEILDTRTALETLGMGLGWFCLGSLPSVRGGLVRPEPMAREVRNKIGNPTRAMQFPKGQTEGQMPVEIYKCTKKC